jgi:general secretion pathway protein C
VGSRVVGLRVGPGAQAGAFAQLGFQGGELVTQINGIGLDDPARAAELVATLGDYGQAVVQVVREDAPQPQAVVIDTSPLHALKQRRR